MLIILHHLILLVEKKKCFALGDGPTDDINYSPSATEKKMSINFTKVN